MDVFQAQIKYDGEWYAAIIIPDKNLVICADDGVTLDFKECEGIISYKTWIDLTEAILGDDIIKPEEQKINWRFNRQFHFRCNTSNSILPRLNINLT